MKCVWLKFLQDQIENRELVLCSNNALLLTDLVHLMDFWRFLKLKDLQ